MNIGNVAHMMIKCVKVASFRVVSRTTVISYCYNGVFKDAADTPGKITWSGVVC